MSPPNRKTHPGFTLRSAKFSLMFMTGHQSGLGARDVEHGANWRGVMRIILTAFEEHPDNVEKIKADVIKKLSESINQKLSESINLMNDFKVTVGIYNESFFPRPKGHMKRVKISMNDINNTTAEFFLKKLKTMKTLRDHCLGVIAEKVNDGLTINHMDIPVTLRNSLRNEFYDSWARRRFPWFNINMMPYKEAMKRKIEMKMEKEREPKRPNIVWYRQ